MLEDLGTAISWSDSPARAEALNYGHSVVGPGRQRARARPGHRPQGSGQSPSAAGCRQSLAAPRCAWFGSGSALVELASTGPGHERGPLVGCENQLRPVWVLGVTN